MRRILTNPFIDSYPKLDVHGETRDSVNILVKEFINDNLKLKNENIVIIHGIGEGILKKEIHNYLKTNKNVIEYKLDGMNIGATIIKLKTRDI